MSRVVDCVTFFDNNFMFQLRYKILEKYVDYFIVCESKYDHAGKKKDKKFICHIQTLKWIQYVKCLETYLIFQTL